MMTVTDRKKPPGDTGHISAHDPWADWKPHRTLKGVRTPHDFQERHSPTENVTVRLTSERSIQRSQRRITDARLWDSMEPSQHDAALQIAFAYETMGRGIGYVTSNWERLPGSAGASNIAESHAQLIRRYIEWAAECTRQKIHHSMIIDVLVFGCTLTGLDRDRRVRKGTSRQNLMAGLDLYAQLQGWG